MLHAEASTSPETKSEAKAAHGDPPVESAARATYDVVSGDYAAPVPGELATKPLDRASPPLLAEPVADSGSSTAALPSGRCPVATTEPTQPAKDQS